MKDRPEVVRTLLMRSSNPSLEDVGVRSCSSTKGNAAVSLMMCLSVSAGPFQSVASRPDP